MKIIFQIQLLLLVFLNGKSYSQSIYFPPKNSTTWDTISPSALGWCTSKIDSLYSFLQQQDTKGFIVLKDGKIVLEKYFGSFTKDSVWYWASAGKTLTSYLIGKAKEENMLKLSDSSSRYLGTNWSNCTPLQESKITILNHLTMTTGLDDGVSDNHCTLNSCLNYLAAPSARWAYHNAPYTLLEKVLTTASGTAINTFTQSKLKVKIGMTGVWATIGYDNVYFSTARSMAKFGLLAQNKYIWENDTLLKDSAYISSMTSSSQQLNQAYGYLWWLNGKSSFMVPTSQIVFPGYLAPHAPEDMFAGIGKNGQLVSVSRKKSIVMIRMGNQVSGGEVPFQLCDNIWEKLNAVMCQEEASVAFEQSLTDVLFIPNPVAEVLTIPSLDCLECSIKIKDLLGNTVLVAQNQSIVDVSKLSSGVYLLTVQDGSKNFSKKIIKL